MQRHVAQREPRLGGQVLHELLACGIEPIVLRHLHGKRAERLSVVPDLDGILRRFGRAFGDIGGNRNAPQVIPPPESHTDALSAPVPLRNTSAMRSSTSSVAYASPTRSEKPASTS